MKKDIATLKSYFETGDIPTENHFADLIDSFHLADGRTISAIDRDINGLVTITMSDNEVITISPPITDEFVPKTGGTFTGNVGIGGPPTDKALHTYGSQVRIETIHGYASLGAETPDTFHFETGQQNIWLGSNVQSFGNLGVSGKDTYMRFSDGYIFENNQRVATQAFVNGFFTGTKAKDSDRLDGLDSSAFLQKSGGTMAGDLVMTNQNIVWRENTDAASIGFKNDSDGDANSYMFFKTADNGNEHFKWLHKESGIAGDAEWMSLKESGLNINGNLNVQNHIYGRSVHNQFSNLYRFGGIYFTWDSDTYGINDYHSIRSTYGQTPGDNLTINSYGHVRLNIDSNNNNPNSRFEIGHNTRGVGNIKFSVDELGTVKAEGDIFSKDSKVATESFVDAFFTGNKAKDSDKLDGINSTSFLRSDADDSFTGKLAVGSTSKRQAGLYGNYDSHKIAHIWSIGTGYKITQTGSSFGNLYGLAYKHTNNTTGGNMAGGHQAVWCHDGTPKVALGSNIWTSGNVYAGGTGYYGDNKRIVRFDDGWLRLNPDSAFGAGIYAGTGIFRTDGQLEVGSEGSKFKVTSGGTVTSAGSITSRSTVNAAGSMSAGGNISSGGDLNVGSNVRANGASYYGDDKEIIRFSDNWLRLNPTLTDGTRPFTSGIYAGTGILRTDGQFVVGSGGSKFKVTSSGQVTADQSVSVTPGDGKGYRFWGSDSYKIYMANADSEIGGRVGNFNSSDFNMYFKMTNGSNPSKDRGFVFKNGNTNVAGIQGDGDAWFRGSLISQGNLTVFADRAGGDVTAGRDVKALRDLSVSKKATIGTDLNVNGNIKGKASTSGASHLFNFGGLYFNFHSNHSGVNPQHSIRSTYGTTNGDSLTMNSYNHIRLNIDANNNNSASRFEIGHNTTGTGGVIFTVHENGNAVAAANVTAYSDRRLKEAFQPITENILDKIDRLKPTYYQWKDKAKDQAKQLGFIAQEVKELFPEWIHENDEHYSMSYDKMGAVLAVQGIKELRAEVKALKEELNLLKNGVTN